MRQKRLSREFMRGLAGQMMTHLRYQSERLGAPALYQFRVPEGGWLTIEDRLIRSRRVLTCWVTTGNAGAMAIGFVTRARGADQDAPWFATLTEKEHDKAIAEISRGIEYAYTNRDLNVVRSNAVQIDPAAAPAPVTPPPIDFPARDRGW